MRRYRIQLFQGCTGAFALIAAAFIVSSLAGSSSSKAGSLNP